MHNWAILAKDRAPEAPLGMALLLAMLGLFVAAYETGCRYLLSLVPGNVETRKKSSTPIA